MKSILIPTDFSATAINATNYAIDFAKQLRIDHIILYNVWHPLTIVDPMSPFVVGDNNVAIESSKSQLQTELLRIHEFCPPHIQIECLSEMRILETGIKEICDKREISYVIMGITGGGAIEAKIIGSNTVSVSETIKVPVIIIPRNCKYEYINKTILLCDFENLDSTLPEKRLKDYLNSTMSELEVINFDPNFKREENSAAFEKFFINDILRDYKPKFSYSLRNDYADALNDYAENNNMQLVITISKKHSWFHKLLHTSHTNKLAFHTHVPLIVMHV